MRRLRGPRSASGTRRSCKTRLKRTQDVVRAEPREADIGIAGMARARLRTVSATGHAKPLSLSMNASRRRRRSARLSSTASPSSKSAAGRSDQRGQARSTRSIEVVRLYRREALHEACRLEVSHRSDDDCPPLESARCRPCLNGPRPGRPSCGRTGAPVWAPTASPEKSGRPRAWSPITPSLGRWCMNRCKRAR